MRLIRHNYDVVIGKNGLDVRLIELLDKREDETGVALELLDEIRPAGGYGCRSFGITEYATVLEGVAYLPVEFIAVGEYDKGG